MMKRIFLLALGACALAGNVQAETVLQQIGAAMELQAEVAARQEVREQAQIAYDNAIVAAKAAQERAAKIEAAYRTQDLHNRLRDLEFRASINGGRLVDGDPIPSIANLYDDAAAIRLYLHDSGYSDLSDGEIAKVRAYMRAQGIRHVAQLGQ